MIIMLINSSKKKSFRSSKRLIAEVLQPITNRVSIGDVPKRVVIELILNLKKNVSKGTSIQCYFESKNVGFRGFKCVQIGVKKKNLEEFEYAESLIDKDLIMYKIIQKI